MLRTTMTAISGSPSAAGTAAFAATSDDGVDDDGASTADDVELNAYGTMTSCAAYGSVVSRRSKTDTRGLFTTTIRL